MLDQYKDSPRDEETLAARREALIEQLGWLVDEADALAPLLAELPAWAMEQSPLSSEFTAKETLDHLATLNQNVYAAWIEQIKSQENVELDVDKPKPNPDANAMELSELLERLKATRNDLIQRVKAVPEAEWTKRVKRGGTEYDLFDLALEIVRHDADCLRDLAYRLHEAKLTERAQDLPK